MNILDKEEQNKKQNPDPANSINTADAMNFLFITLTLLFGRHFVLRTTRECF